MTIALHASQIVWLGSGSFIAGAATGLLAGVFGVGGGTVIVPALYEVFRLYGVPDDILMPLCVGTSLAIIAPTSISSFRGHLQKGAVEAGVLKVWAVPIVLGVVLGAAVASIAKAVVFKAVFIGVCALLAAKLFLNKQSWRLGNALPGPALMRGYGLAIGFTSALMGIGGGLVGNLVLTLYGRPIHAAVATASGVGVLVSLPGAICYVLSGWGRSGLPPLSFGFVSLVALALLTPVSVFATRYGVALAHSLSKRRLELALAAYLVVIAARFALSLI